MNLKSRKSFTLIEMIVSLGLFLFVVLSIIAIYSMATKFQRQVIFFQKLQSETRFIVEAMAREIRMGEIDYKSYKDLSEDLSSGKPAILRLKTLNGEKICFKKENNVLYLAKGSDCLSWNQFSSEKIKITKLDFYLSPCSNPFFECQANADCKLESNNCDLEIQSCKCSGDAQCFSDQVCENSYCKNKDIQPRVTIVLKAEITEKDKTKKINLQTTVSSRIYRR